MKLLFDENPSTKELAAILNMKIAEMKDFYSSDTYGLLEIF